MCNRLLKNFNYVAVFGLGVTSPVWAHIFQIIVGYFKYPDNRDTLMSSVFESMPYNIVALALFIIFLLFIILYSKRQARQDKEKEVKYNDNEKERNNILVNAIKQAIKDGFKEAVNELKTTNGGGKNGQTTDEKTK
jgi:hypothetical protein